KVSVLGRAAARRQVFAAGAPDRLEGVEIAELDVHAARFALLQRRPQSGLQERGLARARFAAQHAEAPLLVADRLQALPQILSSLEVGEVFGIFVPERQQSFDCSDLHLSGFSRFAFGARRDDYGADKDRGDERPEGTLIPAERVQLREEIEQI